MHVFRLLLSKEPTQHHKPNPHQSNNRPKHTATILQKDSKHTELKHINTHTAVTDTETSYRSNKVTKAKPPPIAHKERKLHRGTRMTLTQLRSSYSKILNSYLHRVNPTVYLRCPLCVTELQTTTHIFNCPTNSIALHVHDV